MAGHTDGLPLGLAMGLAQSPVALERFGALSQTEREQWVARAHNVSSQEEMHGLISALAGGRRM